MNFQWMPLRKSDAAQFKRDMRDAFRQGAADGFGAAEKGILPEIHIDRTLNIIPIPMNRMKPPAARVLTGCSASKRTRGKMPTAPGLPTRRADEQARTSAQGRRAHNDKAPACMLQAGALLFCGHPAERPRFCCRAARYSCAPETAAASFVRRAFMTP